MKAESGAHSKPVVYLPDGNILIALTDAAHVSHSRATAWFTRECSAFATCPITQGTLIRYLMRVQPEAGLADAKAFLARVCAVKGHRFWPDSISYSDLIEHGIIGHRQITDAYLVTLARHHKGVVATLNKGMAASHPEHAVLVK